MLHTISLTKKDFPIFQRESNLAYLDNAASTQTPQIVLDAMNEYYTHYRANIHRGLYDLSATATEKYEDARKKVAKFIGAEKNDIIFTSGTTHGLNFLASSLGKNLKKGDNIVSTELEHHANLVPWQMIAKEKGVELRFVRMCESTKDTKLRNDCYELDLDSAKELIDENTKIISFSLVSNVLGSITLANEIIDCAKKVGAMTVVDAAQAVAHIGLDVNVIGCDFLVFSGHKMYGPTGIGVMYGKKEKLETLEPFFYGGDMVSSVSFNHASWADIPERFEGGTPNIAGAIGLGAAVDFIQGIGWIPLLDHEVHLTERLFAELKKIEGVTIIGPEFGEPRVGVVSFVIDGVHPHDAASILNSEHVAVRAGHHCCMQLMERLGIMGGTVRVSLGVYNTEEDVLRLVQGINKVKSIFQRDI